MATANLALSRKLDWPLANPWLWLSAGLALSLWSWLWTLTFGPSSSEYRIIVLALGLLLAGAGIWLRFADRTTTYVSEQFPGFAVLLRMAMGGLFLLVSLGVTVLFVATFFYGDEIGWRAAPTLLVWLSAAPLGFYAARRCLKRHDKQSLLDAEEEIGLALLIGAACAFIGSWTLYLGPSDANDWDTFRLLLRVAASAGLGGAELVLVAIQLRRMMISFLVVLHFTGIITACLSAPAPWLVQQAWVRVFRPYLEFMYLNNAYHFYAPEPGPASYLWFRLIYVDGKGDEQGWWYKVPEIDDKGRHHHTVALEYQRHLAMTESVAAAETLPPWLVVNHHQGFPYMDVGPVFKARLNLQPDMGGGFIMRDGPKSPYPRIPLHPGLPQMQQVIIPNENSRRLLSSYARFAVYKYGKLPEHPDWTFKSVKVYRAIHSIPTVDWYVLHLPPADPMLYRPYYMGNFDAAGVLLDGKLGDEKRDPYLYWLLPILHVDNNDADSEVRDYCRLHAGDSHWVRPAGQKEWQDPRR